MQSQWGITKGADDSDDDEPPALEPSESNKNQVVAYMPEAHPGLNVQECTWGFAKKQQLLKAHMVLRCSDGEWSC